LKKLVILLLAFCASGCGLLLNLTYDQHEYFKELRDSEVGKDINDLVGVIPESWKAAGIVEIVKIDSSTMEYRFTYGECRWATVVNSSTNLVQSWRFLSASEECEALKYHEGPW
jgi:hypothetical protein